MDWIEQWWLEAAFGVALAILTWAWKLLSRRVKKALDGQAALSDGMRKLLRDRILQSCRHWIEKGHCPYESMDSLLLMYADYKILGGSDTLSRLVKTVEALPTVLENDGG